MSFSSLDFLFCFLPAFLALYYLLPRKLCNLILVCASFVFYGSGAGVAQTALLAVLVVVNYSLGRLMDAAERMRKKLLILGVSVNLGCLVFFKLAGVLSGSPGDGWQQAVLPLGISFSVFQSVSYLIDVYRRTVPGERYLMCYSTYAMMFPQLVMGPIVRFQTVSEALHHRNFSREMLEEGFSTFVVGLGCKVILADRLALLWGTLERIGFASISTPLAWLGAAGYSLQLYLDFSGYSLMAEGLGLMLGFSLPHNFNLPYCAASVGDFYRRWHMTLGTWFRDYVYIPLGGSRSGAGKTLCNLLAVWLLTGLWHGVSPNFLLWGFVLFALIALEKFVYGDFLHRHRLLSRLYLLFVMPQTWVIFKLTDPGELKLFFHRLLPFFGAGSAVFSGDFLRQAGNFWWVFLLGFAACTPFPRRFYEKYRSSPVLWLPLLAVFWVSVYLIATSAANPFLYYCF